MKKLKDLRSSMRSSVSSVEKKILSSGHNGKPNTSPRDSNVPVSPGRSRTFRKKKSELYIRALTYLTDEERQTLKVMYSHLAKRRQPTNTLDKETFLQYVPLPGMLGERLFKVFDRASDHVLHKDEFLYGMAILIRGTDEDKFHFLFDIFNLDESDGIRPNELSAVLFSIVDGDCEQFHLGLCEMDEPCKLLTGPEGESLSADEVVDNIVSRAMADFDTNSSGKLEFEQFVEWLKGNELAQTTVFYDSLMSTMSLCISGTSLERRPSNTVLQATGASLAGNLKMKKSPMYVTRYVVLKDASVSIYKERNDFMPSDAIFLGGASVEVDEEALSKGEYKIEIIFPEYTTKFQCTDKAEMDKWLPALKNAAQVRMLEDDYNIFRDRVLGSGAFSDVVYGKNKVTGVDVALKIISKEDMVREEADDLYSEIAILKILAHPNMVVLHDVLETQQQMCIVTEVLEGGDLLRRLETNDKKGVTFNESDAQIIIRQFLEAVHYLHKRGIVHRDLKPNNAVFITKTPGDLRIKVIDFGFAKFVTDDANLEDARGTRKYFAPEVVAGKPHGKPIDMWCIGIIMYRLLLGGFPFTGRDEADLFRNIRASKVRKTAAFEELSSAARELMHELFRTLPKMRITAEKALLHSWLLDSYDSDYDSATNGVPSLPTTPIKEDSRTSLDTRPESHLRHSSKASDVTDDTAAPGIEAGN
eukprot:Clim_evm82s25 gene=Clim_evmTU82s25